MFGIHHYSIVYKINLFLLTTLLMLSLFFIPILCFLLVRIFLCFLLVLSPALFSISFYPVLFLIGMDPVLFSISFYSSLFSIVRSLSINYIFTSAHDVYFLVKNSHSSNSSTRFTSSTLVIIEFLLISVQSDQHFEVSQLE